MKKFAFVLLTLALCACSRNMNAGGEFSSPYHKAARGLTREKKLYGIEKVYYKTSIVYRSCELRRAYVEEYASAYKLDEGKKAAMHEREAAECAKYDDFVVAHFASETATRKLDTTVGVWKITLHSGGGAPAVEPLSVVALPGEPPVIRYFYPFTTPWSKNYVVRFPRQADATDLSLRLDGVEDNLAFVWKRS